MKKTILATALVAALSATSVAAHATLEIQEAPAGSTYRGVMRVPHGCDGQDTIALRIRIPEGFIAAKPMPKAGWTLETVSGPYEHSYEYYGRTLSEGVQEITWSGGVLPDDWYDEFIFRGTLAVSLPEGATLYFLTTQECADGRVEWINIPAEGQDAHSIDDPAPGVKVGAPLHEGH